MEIHKPKPWHGLREFLKEYGIIVLGVLTALGLEQAVEAVHHAEQRHELRQALDQESRQAIVDSKATIAWVDRLMTHRIAQIDLARAAIAGHRPIGVQMPFETSPFDPPTDPAFQAASSSGRLSLLTPKEVAAYSEGHTETAYAKELSVRMGNDDAPVRRFLFKFLRQDGSCDLSNATPAEKHHYLDLLISSIDVLSDFKFGLQFNWGLREALLRGERDLPLLYRAERSRVTPGPAGL